MKLRTITQEESDRLARNNLNPADFAGFDEESGDFITNAEFGKTSALAPANPFMAAVAEPVYRAGADMYRAANRLPAAAAEMLFGKQAGPVASMAAPQGAANMLLQAALEKAAAGSAASRQPGKADTVLSTTSALVSGIAPYLVNPMLGLSASAMQGAGAGSERAQAMGATPGQELANMIGRAGASAALDKIGMLGAAKTPWTREAMTKLAARGAAEGAATQGAFNVADKVTFNPQQDLTEGLPSSALLGAIAPVGLRAGSEGLARLSGAPPVIPAASTATPSRAQILGEGARLPFAERAAFIDRINKQYPNLLGGEGPLTLGMLGGAEGNRMADADIIALMNLAARGPEATTPFASRNQKLLADAVRAGYVDPTGVDAARRILNEGPTAFADIQRSQAGAAAEARLAETRLAAERAAAAARAGNVPNEVKAIAEGENARAASQAELEARTESAAAEVSAGRDFEADIRAAYQLPREYVFSAVDNKGKLAEARAFEKAEAARQKLVSKGIERGVTGKDKYAKDTVLGQLQEPAVRTIDDEGRPMSAEQTLLAEREKAEADKMKQAAAPQAVAEKVAQAVQTVTTGTPAGESTATGAAAAPKPAAPTTPDKVTTLNDTPEIMKATVPKVGNDADKAVDNPPKKGNGPEPQETKTSTAPESKPLVVPGGKPDTSAVRMVGGTSPNPPAAAVVEAGGAQEATPRTPDAWVKDATDDYVRALLARERGEQADIAGLERVLTEFGVDPAAVRAQNLLGEVAPPSNRPATTRDVPPTSALTPDLMNKVQSRLFELRGAQNAPSRQQLLSLVDEVRAGRQPTSALDVALVQLPKDKVAAPVATVESKPASTAEASPAKAVEATPAPAPTPKKPAAPAPLKIKRAPAAADPVAADRAKEQVKIGNKLAYEDESFEAYARRRAQEEGKRVNPLHPFNAGFMEPRLKDAYREDYAELRLAQERAAESVTAQERAVLDKAGLTVRKKPDGTYELYNKEIDEVVRDLGGAASEAEAIGEAVRLAKGPARRESTPMGEVEVTPKTSSMEVAAPSKLPGPPLSPVEASLVPKSDIDALPVLPGTKQKLNEVARSGLIPAGEVTPVSKPKELSGGGQTVVVKDEIGNLYVEMTHKSLKGDDARNVKTYQPLDADPSGVHLSMAPPDPGGYSRSTLITVSVSAPSKGEKTVADSFISDVEAALKAAGLSYKKEPHGLTKWHGAHIFVDDNGARVSKILADVTNKRGSDVQFEGSSAGDISYFEGAIHNDIQLNFGPSDALGKADLDEAIKLFQRIKSDGTGVKILDALNKRVLSLISRGKLGFVDSQEAWSMLPKDTQERALGVIATSYGGRKFRIALNPKLTAEGSGKTQVLSHELGHFVWRYFLDGAQRAKLEAEMRLDDDMASWIKSAYKPELHREEYFAEVFSHLLMHKSNFIKELGDTINGANYRLIDEVTEAAFNDPAQKVASDWREPDNKDAITVIKTPTKVSPFITQQLGAGAAGAKGLLGSGGMGSKLNKSRQDEAGFVLFDGEAIEKAARAVGGAVGSTVRKIGENIRSATNQLGDYADRKNDETARTAYRAVNKMATFGAVDGAKIANENQRIWSKLSSAERAELDERLAYEMAYKTKLPGRMSPRAQAAYDEYKQHARELGERAAREGPMINEGGELRPLIIDEFWSPENLSPAAIKRLENLDTRQEAIDEVRAWWRQYGLSQEQIDKEIQRFDIIGKYADADLEFDALHNPMAAPLPPGWAGNKQDAFNRYAMKYAFDMARHKYIDQDPLLGPMSRKQREGLDEVGRPTARQFEAGEIGDNVDSLFRAALNSFALQLNPGRRGVREGAVTAAHRSVVQTAAHALDTIRMIPETVADAGVKNAFKGLIDGITKYDELKSRGLVKDTGNLSGDVQRIGEALKGPFVRGKLDALNEALGAQGRLSGVDIMNKFMQAMSAAAGVARAKEAIVKNDDAFFKRVGLSDWRSMTPEQVEEFVGKWVTEGSQSSMGAKDLPMTFLTQGGFGRNFVPIMRWAFGYTNQQIDRAFKPLFDSGLKPIDRVRPLAVRLVGSAAAAQVGQMLVGALFGRDDRSVSSEEWEAAGKPGPLKRIAQKATELQILPAIVSVANVMLGNAQMPRNLAMEVPNKLKDQLLAMAETKRDLDAQDILTVLDATLDTLSSNWRDVSKVVAGETRDPIEQARARFEGMDKTMLSRPARNPLNLGTALNEAKTEEEVFEIGKRILATATIETPDVSVAGPSEDAAFLEWLRKTDPTLHAEYVKKNFVMAAGADKLYNTKKAVAETVNKLLEQKKKGLVANEPDSVKAARGLKIDWKKGELDVK